jgi:hypothetical protein
VSQLRPNDPISRYAPAPGGGVGSPSAGALTRPASRDSLADLLERVLDKGVVIAGDIKINLLDIELLTIKVRLLIASADKAKEMGIDWWAHDPQLSSRASSRDGNPQLDRENQALRRRVEELESRLNALQGASAATAARSRAGLPHRARTDER